MWGESWLAVKCSRPSSQNWAPGVCSHVMYKCLCERGLVLVFVVVIISVWVLSGVG